jgi:signal transduction histidine kinase
MSVWHGYLRWVVRNDTGRVAKLWSIPQRDMRLRTSPGRPAGDNREIASAVAKFALSGLAVLVLVAVGGELALRSLGTSQAVTDARRVTAVAGRGIIAPALTPAVLRGDPKAIAGFDRIIRRRVLGPQVARVKLWSADGRILYSDQPRLIGRRFPLEPDELAALRGGAAAADVTDLSRPENRLDRGQGKLLQVYLGIHARDGTPVLFEEYLRYGAIAGNGNAVWRLFAPLMAGALIALAALQLPLAWRMARRLRDGQRDRERLLVRAVEASDAERRLIAAGLHDGIVQELAGLSFSMAAAADRADRGSEAQGTLAAGAAGTRNAIRALRTLLVEIYPPRLREQGVAAVLADLAASVSAHGIDVDVDVADADSVDEHTQRLVFRVAQEALRNVTSHSAATRAEVRLTVGPMVVLEVRDNGRGFSEEELEQRRADGHMGLQLLADMAQSEGATLEVTSVSGQGTTVRLEAPP